MEIQNNGKMGGFSEDAISQISIKLNECAKFFKNPRLTLVILADDIPKGSMVLTRDNVKNPIEALKVFRHALSGELLSIEDIVDLHKELTKLQQFVGNILPEEISPEKLNTIGDVQELIELIIKSMKKRAISHQFT